MSLELTASNFKTLFPAFKDEEDSSIELRINIAKKKVSQTVFCDEYEEAVLTHTAHDFAYAQHAAEGDEFLGKELISHSVGGASFNFKASIGDGDEDYKSTVYGRQFLAIRKRTYFIPGGF